MLDAVLDGLLAALLLCLLALVVIAARRRLLQRRGGALDLSLRVRPERRHGHGWSAGVGRVSGDELEVYRVFSLAARPRRVLSRLDLDVVRHREPTAAESIALQRGSVVVELASGDGPVELAVDAGAVAGLLAWIEARPPGRLPA